MKDLAYYYKQWQEYLSIRRTYTDFPHYYAAMQRNTNFAAKVNVDRAMFDGWIATAQQYEQQRSNPISGSNT